MRLAGHEATMTLPRAGNPTDLSSQAKRESRRIFYGGLGGHEKLPISDPRRRGPLRDKSQLEAADDAVHYGKVGDESDESLALA